MVSIIVAVAQNGIIGDRNSLLWHISEDMRFSAARRRGIPSSWDARHSSRSDAGRCLGATI